MRNQDKENVPQGVATKENVPKLLVNKENVPGPLVNKENAAKPLVNKENVEVEVLRMPRAQGFGGSGLVSRHEFSPPQVIIYRLIFCILRFKIKKYNRQTEWY